MWSRAARIPANAASTACSTGDDERDDGAVVRRVGRDVEHRDALDGGDRVTDGGDDLGTAAFGEIRNALDELHLACGGLVASGVEAEMRRRGRRPETCFNIGRAWSASHSPPLSHPHAFQQPRVHRRIAGDDRQCGSTGAGAPVAIGDDAARFAHQQECPRRCPTARASAPRIRRSGRRRRRRGRAPPSPARRMPATSRMTTRQRLHSTRRRDRGVLNGKPVPMSAARDRRSSRRVIGWPFRRAPPPAVAVNSSPVATLSTDAGHELAVDERGDRHRVPRDSRAESSSCRRAGRRRTRAPTGSRVDGDSSSPSTRASGWRDATISVIARSASRSTSLTKSVAPFRSQVSEPRVSAPRRMISAARAAAATQVASSARALLC